MRCAVQECDLVIFLCEIERNGTPDDACNVERVAFSEVSTSAEHAWISSRICDTECTKIQWPVALAKAGLGHRVNDRTLSDMNNENLWWGCLNQRQSQRHGSGGMPC